MFAQPDLKGLQGLSHAICSGALLFFLLESCTLYLVFLAAFKAEYFRPEVENS